MTPGPVSAPTSETLSKASYACTRDKSLPPWFGLYYAPVYVNQVNCSTQRVSTPVELEKVPGTQGVHVEAATAAREQNGGSVGPRQSVRRNIIISRTNSPDRQKASLNDRCGQVHCLLEMAPSTPSWRPPHQRGESIGFPGRKECPNQFHHKTIVSDQPSEEVT